MIDITMKNYKITASADTEVKEIKEVVRHINMYADLEHFGKSKIDVLLGCGFTLFDLKIIELGGLRKIQRFVSYVKYDIDCKKDEVNNKYIITKKCEKDD